MCVCVGGWGGGGWGGGWGTDDTGDFVKHEGLKFKVEQFFNFFVQI